MKFCPECKAMMRPKAGVMTCAKCGHSETKAEPTANRFATTESTGRDRVVLEEKEKDVRQTHQADCEKCGHEYAYFHLMQTRRSDEPPTTINECMSCGHSWREY